MLTQIIIRYFDTFTDNLEVLKDKAVSLVLENTKKISYLSMASKMFTLAVFFAFVPMGTIPGKNHTYDTQVKFENSAQILAGKQNVAVETGESNEDKTKREQNEAIATAARMPVTVESRSYSDPSDFRPIYQAAGARFGIPWQLIEAVHEVESGKSGSTTKRSYAGAQGPMQFMPGTWRTYAVDGDGDGSADATNVVDAIYGAANLLASSGAADGDIDGALFNYNHAQWYVNKVKAIAYEIGM
ncbi:hypothetical protein A2V71_04120 [Candidatus Berkelbacteria bacterium RBG_13_40_8]|uniref:Transglycosylase SLT domain-containing protein n=1 Tax=Candidatus Berkelbacteria bacterium RBG_13_40_8 TaxID=1797467 RepID=A0A1F5DPE6_9BACT|nr:MAG: hypothetical protein A2V71_04120 [Candidatus Berkelbacteria bacterium RBG_13_40_8]